MPTPIGGTRTREETDPHPTTLLDRPWNVIVHDDPVTQMVYVVKVLMEVFGYPRTKSQKLMLEVHNTGSSVVWSGGRERAEVHVAKLHGRQLLATLEQSDAE